MEPWRREPDLRPFYHQLLSPLSLFPRKETPPEPPKPLSQEHSVLQSIPLPKLKVGQLCRQVSKRLAGSGRAARVSPEDRLRLTEVILEELKCSWQEPPPEPILNYENNLKLRKRLESYVLICSEQLFIRYLHLLVTLPPSRKVFTEPAILSRLAASLARDCTVFLTSPDVYRCLLADFQILRNLEQTQDGLSKLRPPVCPPGTFKLCPITWPHSTGLDQVPCSSLNLNYLIQLSRPYEFTSEPEPDPVKELKSIPLLKGRKRLLWVPSMKKEKESEVRTSQMAALPGHSPPSSKVALFPSSPVLSRLQRGQSMPCLREGWRLADELGLPPLSPRPQTPLILTPEITPLLFGDVVAEDLDLVGLNTKKTSSQQLRPEKEASVTLLPRGKGRDNQSGKGVWSNWWKTAVSSDDYFKFLDTQETDFLHVIFRMYEEDVPVEVPPPVKETLRIRHPPPLQEDEEPEFVPGEWNWNPLIEDSMGPGKARILNLQQRLNPGLGAGPETHSDTGVVARETGVV